MGCYFLLQGTFLTPGDQTHISCISCIGKWILYHWATWEAQWAYRRTIILVMRWPLVIVMPQQGQYEHGSCCESLHCGIVGRPWCWATEAARAPSQPLMRKHKPLEALPGQRRRLEALKDPAHLFVMRHSGVFFIGSEFPEYSRVIEKE